MAFTSSTSSVISGNPSALSSGMTEAKEVTISSSMSSMGHRSQVAASLGVPILLRVLLRGDLGVRFGTAPRAGGEERDE